MTAAAEALAAAGRTERAEQAAREAEIASRSSADTDRRSDGFMSIIAEAFSAAGMHEQAETIVRSITTRRIQASAMTRVAEALIAESLSKSAKRAARQVEALASAMPRQYAGKEEAQGMDRCGKGASGDRIGPACQARGRAG